jgi:signal transduction histidine kinase/GAF domain-containing protein
MADSKPESTANQNQQQMNSRAEAVYRATLAIATELSLDAALQKITDSARDLVRARYAALGVVDEEKRGLSRFVVSGVNAEQIKAMDHWPHGLGLLGELIHFPRPLRVRDISKDPRSVGFPQHHPPMTNFLGVPIIRSGNVFGNLYMADKLGAEEFSSEDEEILSLFAAHAAIAIENARLYTETDIQLKAKVVQVEREERRSRFLSDLGAMLLRLSPGEELPLDMIAERATEPLGDAAAVYLVNPSALGEVVASTVFHRDPNRREVAQGVLAHSLDALIHDVVEHQRPSLISRVSGQELQGPFSAQDLLQGRFSAALAVPIVSRQSTYGMLVSLASRPLTFIDGDLRFSALIADRLGAALDSALLFRRELEARTRVEELAELAQHRASELETILDTMAEAVYVMDAGMKLIRLNAAYARLVGLELRVGAAGSLQRHFAMLKPRNEEGQPMLLESLPMARALRGETFTNQVVLITPNDDEKDRFLSISGAPIRDAGGRIVAAVNVARDVTEAKEIDLLKDEFISVASHELKTPLTVVKGYAQILLQNLEGAADHPGEAGMARRILDQTNRLATLAERLLDVSRIQFGRLLLERQRTDLADLVRETCERMRMSAQGHSIHAQTVDQLPAMVDQGRIEQVVSNLISNALKYSPDGSDVAVSLSHKGNWALISVRDHGYGIPQEQQSQIFQRFFRATSGQKKSGVGLGLYVSKGIVEAHGGKIWFESQEGSGTTFHVQLPAEE